MPKIYSFSRNGLKKKQYFCLFVNSIVHQASNKLASYKLFSIVSDIRTFMALQIYTVATVWYFVMHK